MAKKIPVDSKSKPASEQVTIKSITNETNYNHQVIRNLVAELDKLKQLESQPTPQRTARIFTKKDRETILGTIHAAALKKQAKITIKSITNETNHSYTTIRRLVAELDKLKQLESQPPNKHRTTRIFTEKDRETILGTIHAAALKKTEHCRASCNLSPT